MINFFDKALELLNDRKKAASLKFDNEIVKEMIKKQIAICENEFEQRDTIVCKYWWIDIVNLLPPDQLNTIYICRISDEWCKTEDLQNILKQ